MRHRKQVVRPGASSRCIGTFTSGPPRSLQQVCFLWLLLQMETLCSRDKLPTRPMPHRADPQLAARQTADLYFYIKRFQNVAG